MIETPEILLENQYLKEKLSQLEVQFNQSQSKAVFLQYQLDELRRMIFGAKSERFVTPVIPGQLNLEMDIKKEEAIETADTIVVDSHERKKNKKKENHPLRQPFPLSLPREEIIIYPQGYNASSIEQPIGEEVTEVLEEIPGKFFVKRYRRLKFAKKEEGGVVIGDLPSRPIEKGLFGELLLTRILIDKYCDHLPLYRQQQRFFRAGIKIAYSTLVDVPRQLCKLLDPLNLELKKQTLTGKYLQIDETPHPVLDPNVKGKTHRGFLWVYRSVEQRLVLFDYCPGRGKEWPREILKNYKGFIQTDGYPVYNEFEHHPDITLIGCMAHARRYFEKASDNDQARSEFFMMRLQQVYAVEQEIRDENKTDAEILMIRKEQSLPVLNELEIWLKENSIQTTPATPIGKAIGYSLARWKKLTAYIHHPFLEIDNNLVENAIRPTVLGRKNYLFSGSHEGAQRSAMIYSFIGSCKMNDVNPQEWFADILLKLPDTKSSELYKLLPNYWKES